jgi:hypothetical protein
MSTDAPRTVTPQLVIGAFVVLLGIVLFFLRRCELPSQRMFKKDVEIDHWLRLRNSHYILLKLDLEILFASEYDSQGQVSGGY